MPIRTPLVVPATGLASQDGHREILTAAQTKIFRITQDLTVAMAAPRHARLAGPPAAPRIAA
jgi:hypothetical protein